MHERNFAPALEDEELEARSLTATEIPEVGRGARFQAFVESAVTKASESFEIDDPMVLKLSLMLRKVNQLNTEDANRKIYIPDGWTTSSFRVCFALWVAGSLPPHRISQATNLSRATVSAVVKKVEKEGLVERKRSEIDQRSTVLSLTEEGHAAISRSYQSHIHLEHEWFAALTDIERLLLFSLLQKLLHSPLAD